MWPRMQTTVAISALLDHVYRRPSGDIPLQNWRL
jgi:hypothetical protein